MKWNIDYQKDVVIDIALEGDTGYRAGHQFGPESPEYQLLAPQLERIAAQVDDVEREQRAVNQATAALQARLETIKAERDSLQEEVLIRGQLLGGIVNG